LVVVRWSICDVGDLGKTGCRASVSGNDEYLLHEWGLVELPRKGMFSAAIAHKQDAEWLMVGT
jgi:hypothetical protein